MNFIFTNSGGFLPTYPKFTMEGFIYQKYFVNIWILLPWVLRSLSSRQSKSRLLMVSDLIAWFPIRQILDEMLY